MSNTRPDKKQELLKYVVEVNGKGKKIAVNDNAPYAKEVIQCFTDLQNIQMLTKANIENVASNAEHASEISKGIEYLQTNAKHLLKLKNVIETIINSKKNASEVAKALFLLNHKGINLESSTELLEALSMLENTEEIRDFIADIMTIRTMDDATATRITASLKQLEEKGELTDANMHNVILGEAVAEAKSKLAKLTDFSMFSESDRTPSNDPHMTKDPGHQSKPGKSSGTGK